MMDKREIARHIADATGRVTFEKKEGRSDVWSYFELVFIDGKFGSFVRCVVCGMLLVYKKRDGTKGMLQHAKSCTELRSDNATFGDSSEFFVIEEAEKLDMSWSNIDSKVGIKSNAKKCEIARQIQEGTGRVSFEKKGGNIHSPVWGNFDLVLLDGEFTKLVRCSDCGILLKWKKSDGTSGLTSHVKACAVNRAKYNQAQMLASSAALCSGPLGGSPFEDMTGTARNVYISDTSPSADGTNGIVTRKNEIAMHIREGTGRVTFEKRCGGVSGVWDQFELVLLDGWFSSFVRCSVCMDLIKWQLSDSNKPLKAHAHFCKAPDDAEGDGEQGEEAGLSAGVCGKEEEADPITNLGIGGDTVEIKNASSARKSDRISQKNNTKLYISKLMEEGSERVTFEKGREKFEKRTRRGVMSSVWSHFELVSVDGEQSAFVRCVHCMALLKWSSSMGTSGLRKHAMACGSFAIKAAVTRTDSEADSRTGRAVASKAMAGSVATSKHPTTSKATPGRAMAGRIAPSRFTTTGKDVVKRTIPCENTTGYSDNEDTIYSPPSPPTHSHSPLLPCVGAITLQYTSPPLQGNSSHLRHATKSEVKKEKYEIMTLMESRPESVSYEKYEGTSKVWMQFERIRVDGELCSFVRCTGCQTVLRWKSRDGTSGLRAHARLCVMGAPLMGAPCNDDGDRKRMTGTDASDRKPPVPSARALRTARRRTTPLPATDPSPAASDLSPSPTSLCKISVADRRELTSAIVDMCAVDIRLLSVIESEGFRTLVTRLLSLGAKYGNISFEDVWPGARQGASGTRMEDPEAQRDGLGTEREPSGIPRPEVEDVPDSDSTPSPGKASGLERMPDAQKASGPEGVSFLEEVPGPRSALGSESAPSHGRVSDPDSTPSAQWTPYAQSARGSDRLPIPEEVVQHQRMAGVPVRAIEPEVAQAPCSVQDEHAPEGQQEITTAPVCSNDGVQEAALLGEAAVGMSPIAEGVSHALLGGEVERIGAAERDRRRKAPHDVDIEQCVYAELTGKRQRMEQDCLLNEFFPQAY